MTGQQIDRDRLRALAENATPGPWESVWDEADEWYSITGQSYEGFVCPEVATLTDEDDAEFIAAARSAVPALLGMLDQAEARLARVRRDAAREALDGLAAELMEAARDCALGGDHRGAGAWRNASAHTYHYRDTHYPKTED